MTYICRILQWHLSEGSKELYENPLVRVASLQAKAWALGLMNKKRTCELIPSLCFSLYHLGRRVKLLYLEDRGRRILCKLHHITLQHILLNFSHVSFCRWACLTSPKASTLVTHNTFKQPCDMCPFPAVINWEKKKEERRFHFFWTQNICLATKFKRKLVYSRVEDVGNSFLKMLLPLYWSTWCLTHCPTNFKSHSKKLSIWS